MAATAFFSHAALRHPHCSLVDRAKLITRHRRERQTAAGLRPERAGEGARGVSLGMVISHGVKAHPPLAFHEECATWCAERGREGQDGSAR